MTRTEPSETKDNRKRSTGAPDIGVVPQAHSLNNLAYYVQGDWEFWQRTGNNKKEHNRFFFLKNRIEILELKNTNRNKNSTNGLNSRCKIEERRISELKKHTHTLRMKQRERRAHYFKSAGNHKEKKQYLQMKTN